MAVDTKSRIFIFNRAAQRITGYQYSEVIGRHCKSIFRGKFCLGSGNAQDEQGQDVLRRRVTFRRRDRSERLLEMSTIQVSTPINEAIGALIMFRDVTPPVQHRGAGYGDYIFHGIVGAHRSMRRIIETINEIADSNVPVMVQGESGTGKEMVALAIHENSSRANQPFVPVNCSALPEGLLESELFGHVKGAFTGAIRDKKGRFELADAGTIFLDEIGELPLSTQVKLLRVLQEKSFMPVGGESPIKVDVRVICASNRDTKALVRTGEFREDLYFRLAVIPIQMPPLRERKSDIPLLVKYFLEIYAHEAEKPECTIEPLAMNALISYDWPGNVRELTNVIQYGLIKCDKSTITLEHLPADVVGKPDDTVRLRRGRKPKYQLSDVLSTLDRLNGNKSLAAKSLGISRPTLYSYLKQTRR